MKILKLSAENVKRLQVVEITPKGALVEIAGKNGNGKTSVLDSIYWALAGGKAVQEKPIRDGQERAVIEVTLGDGETVSLIVERTFTAQNSYLTVKTPDGAKYPKPQQMLEDLLGALTFDPLLFMRAKPQEQFEILRRLVTLEVDLDALAKERAALFAERTEANRQVQTLRARLQESADLAPQNAVDVRLLMDRLDQISAHNAEVRQAEEILSRQVKATADAAAKVRDLEAALAHEREKLRKHEAELQLIRERGVPEAIDPGPIKQEIALATERNRAADLWARRVRDEEEYGEAVRLVEDIESAMEAIDRRRQGALERAEMPVPGLSLGDGSVTFNGLPIEQASDAEQLKVSTAIAAALNPKLRVIRIRDGSLLDDDAMAWLAEFAAKSDMQIWIERVGEGSPGAIVMEDGHVRGAHVSD